MTLRHLSLLHQHALLQTQPGNPRSKPSLVRPSGDADNDRERTSTRPERFKHVQISRVGHAPTLKIGLCCETPSGPTIQIFTTRQGNSTTIILLALSSCPVA